ncbi:MAG: adenine-specific methyltransferase EcoRI family protein [Paludibacteraceae bacterium]|nr:adenine-specific methyltransferase EcoRI family protein [Paludibacteraceae bacterium]
MAKNSNLHAAKVAKNDEFYTMLTDIEKEMSNYKDFFKGKVVYCNCDDARESNFFKYFSSRFEELGLKKLITTGYKPEGRGVVLVYEGDKNGNRKVEDEEITIKELEGTGDFRSPECIEFLKEADVVVTNPPFSLFREYVKQLMDYGKKFIIIGNQNAITYKEIFPYIKNNELWLGASMNGANRWFYAPDNYEVKENAAGYKVENGRKMFFVNGVVWFTNISNEKRNTKLDLFKRYSNEYPKYDNYDAIEVSRVENIPMDYDGVMGVPISFLHKYNPEQFEIVKFRKGDDDKDLAVNGKTPYFRILIRRKSS